MEPNNISTATTQNLDADLLRRAMEEVDRDYSARAQASERRDSKSVLQKGADLWKSAGVGIAKAGLETKDFLLGEPEEHEKSDLRRGIEQRGRELAAESPFNAMSTGISQFATGLLGAGKLMAPMRVVQKLKAAGKTGRAAYEVGRGAMVGAVAIDPHEERLSNLIQSFPDLQNPVTDYLAASPEDSAAEGRFKNALEGIGLDLAIIGVLGSAVRGYRFLREGDEAKAAKEFANLEKAQAANRDAFGLDFGPTPRETPAETHPAPSASTGSNLPAQGPEADSGALRVATSREDDVASAASPSGETNQTGGINPDLPSPNRETPPNVALLEASPEDMAAILKATDTGLKAIKQFGTREAAAEAGRMASRSESVPKLLMSGV